MFEKVNPSHPDKIADRIAGAIVDLAYKKNKSPKVAVEVLIGHGNCHIINETSERFTKTEIKKIVNRIAGNVNIDYKEVPQDKYLAGNQKQKIRCGDNGIFKGVPITLEQEQLTKYTQFLYGMFPYDGKFILNLLSNKLIICQSNVKKDKLEELCNRRLKLVVNPLGFWTGGIDVDSGATNRKLGSDMGDSVTGGGLHGKDLSKADVSVNIYCFLKAQEIDQEFKLQCAIGDEKIDGKPYSEIVKIASDYINRIGGFEKFAEWGLIR